MPSPYFCLQDNTDQAVAAFVDDALQRLLHFFARLARHFIELVEHTVVDKVVQGLADNVGFPYLGRIILVFAQDVGDQVFRLLFIADDRGDLGLHVRL